MERFARKDGRKVYTASQRVARYCELCYRMVFFGDEFIKQPGSGKVRHWFCHKREIKNRIKIGGGK